MFDQIIIEKHNKFPNSHNIMERSWDGATKLNESGKHRLLSENKVEVELIPEKKGLVIKHVEYLVTSTKHQSQVYLQRILS